jgi:hypothetical protein
LGDDLGGQVWEDRGGDRCTSRSISIASVLEREEIPEARSIFLKKYGQVAHSG